MYCGIHNYFGPLKLDVGTRSPRPGKGCSRCWFVYYLHDIATTPPNERQTRLEELQEVIHKVVEEVEKGTWDFNPFVRPEISFGEEN